MSQILWNLAFSQENRRRILELGGSYRLRQVLGKADDVLKKDIDVILYMLTDQHAPSDTYASPPCYIFY